MPVVSAFSNFDYPDQRTAFFLESPPSRWGMKTSVRVAGLGALLNGEKFAPVYACGKGFPVRVSG